MVCKECERDFKLMPTKPGFANICPTCTEENPPKEPEKLMATVAWSGKHTPEINITDRKTAIAFNNANRRRAATACLNFTSYSYATDEKSDRDGSSIGTSYRTSLGEVRKVR
jgi:hypothetical protein